MAPKTALNNSLPETAVSIGNKRRRRAKLAGIAVTISPAYLWMSLFLAIPMIFIFMRKAISHIIWELYPDYSILTRMFWTFFLKKV